MNTIKVLTREHGDRTVAIWNPADAQSTAEAEQVFIRLKTEGKAGFVVTQKDGKGNASEASLIHTFDADAEEIIFTAPLIGG